jgi:hypothetical protein
VRISNNDPLPFAFLAFSIANACARHPVLPASTKTTCVGVRAHVADRPSCVSVASVVVTSAHSAKNIDGRWKQWRPRRADAPGADAFDERLPVEDKDDPRACDAFCGLASSASIARSLVADDALRMTSARDVARRIDRDRARVCGDATRDVTTL